MGEIKRTMSKQRNITSRDLPPRRKNEDGKYICRWCGGICPGRRTGWCSQKCIDEYWLLANPATLRHRTFERDKGVCAKCGLDTELLKWILHALSGGDIKARDGHYYSINYHGRTDTPIFHGYDMQWKPEDAKWLLEIIGAERGGQRQYWDADHILPISEGGGCCGLDNIQTLCIGCHKEETRELHRRLKRKRDPQGRIFGEDND